MSFVSVALGAGVGTATSAPLGLGAGFGSYLLRNIFGGGGGGQPFAPGQGFNPVGGPAGGDQYGNQTSNTSLPTGFGYNPWTQTYQNSGGTTFGGQLAQDADGDKKSDFGFIAPGADRATVAPSGSTPGTSMPSSPYTPPPGAVAVPKGSNPWGVSPMSQSGFWKSLSPAAMFAGRMF